MDLFSRIKSILLILPVAMFLQLTALTAQAYPKLPYTQVTTTGYHSCALDANGKAFCWGSPSYGALGNGHSTGSIYYSPIPVSGDHRFVKIKAHGPTTCGLEPSGQLWCWGQNDRGQAGIGDTEVNVYEEPHRVAGDTKFKDIFVGYHHTCAIDIEDNAWCWGANQYYQLGDGTPIDRYVPTLVAGGYKFKTLTPNAGLTCGVDLSDNLLCWGNNYNLFHDSPSTHSTPYYAPVSLAITDLGSTPNPSMCAVDQSNQLYCLGRNAGGALGLGHNYTLHRESPQNISGDYTYLSVTDGNRGHCALRSDKRAVCWGEDGTLGRGEEYDSNPYAPGPVSGDLTFSQVSRKASSTCGVETSGLIYCWGPVVPTGYKLAFGKQYVYVPSVLDTDGDTIRDDVDNCFGDPNPNQEDMDGDQIGDHCDTDIDGDGVDNTADAFPSDASETTDTDGDGVGDNSDLYPTDPTESRDTDGDGVGDNGDAFPNDPSETTDTDGDGLGDNADEYPTDPNRTRDSDGDGIDDLFDAFPHDPSESSDSDGDAVGDNSDNCPNTQNTNQEDFDQDGLGDACDLDDDNDGLSDSDEALQGSDPRNPNTDGDRFVLDGEDNCPAVFQDNQVDFDGDGAGDACDTDDDNDGANDGEDAFPHNPNETLDSDGDGKGDNGDAFPNDPSETTDTDGDGVGDNSDPFPTDPTESRDSDSDGVGDNSDEFPYDPDETTDTDGDGVGDNADAFPNDPSETRDPDGDGVGNNSDAFPRDPNEWQDSDGDGIGNNGDLDDDNDGIYDVVDPEPYTPNETTDELYEAQSEGGETYDEVDPDSALPGITLSCVDGLVFDSDGSCVTSTSSNIINAADSLL